MKSKLIKHLLTIGLILILIFFIFNNEIIEGLTYVQTVDNNINNKGICCMKQDTPLSDFTDCKNPFDPNSQCNTSKEACYSCNQTDQGWFPYVSPNELYSQPSGNNININIMGGCNQPKNPGNIDEGELDDEYNGGGDGNGNRDDGNGDDGNRDDGNGNGNGDDGNGNGNGNGDDGNVNGNGNGDDGNVNGNGDDGNVNGNGDDENGEDNKDTDKKEDDDKKEDADKDDGKEETKTCLDCKDEEEFYIYPYDSNNGINNRNNGWYDY